MVLPTGPLWPLQAPHDPAHSDRVSPDPSWPPGPRTRAAVAHALVNGAGVVALAAMHLWGSLDPAWAAGGILALCGIWAHHTKLGPPGGPPGAAGLAALLAQLGPRH